MENVSSKLGVELEGGKEKSKLTICAIPFLILLPDQTRIRMRTSSIHIVGVSNLDCSRLTVEGDELFGVRVETKLGSTSFGG